MLKWNFCLKSRVWLFENRVWLCRQVCVTMRQVLKNMQRRMYTVLKKYFCFFNNIGLGGVMSKPLLSSCKDVPKMVNYEQNKNDTFTKLYKTIELKNCFSAISSACRCRRLKNKWLCSTRYYCNANFEILSRICANLSQKHDCLHIGTKNVGVI